MLGEENTTFLPVRHVTGRKSRLAVSRTFGHHTKLWIARKSDLHLFRLRSGCVPFSDFILQRTVVEQERLEIIHGKLLVLVCLTKTCVAIPSRCSSKLGFMSRVGLSPIRR